MAGEYAFQPVNFTKVAVANVTPQYHIALGSGSVANCGLGVLKTGVLLGVVQSVQSATGQHQSICPFGQSKVVAGGVIALGARITCSTSGRAAAAASGDTIVGYAMEAAAADGDVITAFVTAFNDKMIA